MKWQPTAAKNATERAAQGTFGRQAGGRSLRVRAHLTGFAAVAVAALLLAAPAVANVPAGFDLFETDPEQTVFRFQDSTAIPANFFDQGSQPFTGAVNFGGEPVGLFQGKDVGDADTIVHRLQNAVLAAPFPAQAFVPIELVSLNLVSVQPITVTVNGQPQDWGVSAVASPVRPSQGDIRILQTAPEGGAFDSALQVYPKFTFRRLSDGAVKTLDAGELFPPGSQGAQELILRANAVPWRDGCAPPALAVPGLNDGFCPAFTPAKQKQLAIEEARLAKHGIRPAQPRLEHFHCYELGRTAVSRSVSLQDQFGATKAKATRLVSLCNPTQKNRERFTNRIAHLACYAITEKAVKRPDVAVRNQYGFDRLVLGKAQRLCLPSLKTKPSVTKRPAVRAGTLTDHFKCYSARSPNRFTARPATLRDQFGRRQVRVLRPALLCAPVQKNKTPAQHPVRHLVCYAVRDPATFKHGPVKVFNQFGVRKVRVLAPSGVCVPSLKLKLP
jgi:hypothetical protein